MEMVRNFEVLSHKYDVICAFRNDAQKLVNELYNY